MSTSHMFSVNKEKGFAPLVILIIVFILAVAGLVFYVVIAPKLMNKTIPNVPYQANTQNTTPVPNQSSSSTQSSSVSPQTEYKNPFDKNTQYVNPFSQSQNPFDSLQ